jgi:LmbE family N-acetylglucosaminyl deacetylase
MAHPALQAGGIALNLRSAARRLARLRRFVHPMDRATDVLAQMAALPFGDLATIFGPGPILVLAPHPDDESLGCGGLIRQACAAGEEVHVAVLTEGTQSHPNSRAYPSPRLQALRECEAAEATAALGLVSDRLSFFRYPDGAAPLRGKRLHAAAAQLANYMRERGIRTVCVSWEHDPHSDHLAAHRITVEASRLIKFRHLSYAVWGWTLPRTTWLPRVPIRGFRLDITADLFDKRRAIACHRSQMTDMIADDRSAFRLPQGLLDICDRPFETFLENGA